MISSEATRPGRGQRRRILIEGAVAGATAHLPGWRAALAGRAHAGRRHGARRDDPAHRPAHGRRQGGQPLRRLGGRERPPHHRLRRAQPVPPHAQARHGRAVVRRRRLGHHRGDQPPRLARGRDRGELRLAVLRGRLAPAVLCRPRSLRLAPGEPDDVAALHLPPRPARRARRGLPRRRRVGVRHRLHARPAARIRPPTTARCSSATTPAAASGCCPRARTGCPTPRPPRSSRPARRRPSTSRPARAASSTTPTCRAARSGGSATRRPSRWRSSRRRRPRAACRSRSPSTRRAPAIPTGTRSASPGTSTTTAPPTPRGRR